MHMFHWSHSLTFLFAHLPACLFTHSFTWPPIHPHSLAHTYTHSLTQPPTHMDSHPPIQLSPMLTHPSSPTVLTHPPKLTCIQAPTHTPMPTLLLTHLPTSTHPHTHLHIHTLTTHPLSQEWLYSEGWLLGMFIIKKKWFGLGRRRSCQWPALCVCVCVCVWESNWSCICLCVYL